MGSDVERDGMFLELADVTLGTGDRLAEWFYSDVTHTMELTEHQPAIPSAVLDWFRNEAERRLPPREGADANL
jgi:hypothetical protein